MISGVFYFLMDVQFVHTYLNSPEDTEKLILFLSVDSQALFSGVALETLRQDSRVFRGRRTLPLVLCVDN